MGQRSRTRVVECSRVTFDPYEELRGELEPGEFYHVKGREGREDSLSVGGFTAAFYLANVALTTIDTGL